MNIFKKLFGKRRKKAESKETECWYNDTKDKPKKGWSAPTEAGYFDGSHFDQAITNQIAKR